MTSAAARTALEIADWRRRVFALYDAVREAGDPEEAHELWRIERDALFFNVAMHPRVDLAVQLGCELTESGFIASAPQDRGTSVDGVYAVGNCADPMLNVPMSIADGARAAVFINVHLLAPPVATANE